MLRVCGVTFDHMINYGSCSQVYSLQITKERINLEKDRSRCDLPARIKLGG